MTAPEDVNFIPATPCVRDRRWMVVGRVRGNIKLSPGLRFNKFFIRRLSRKINMNGCACPLLRLHENSRARRAGSGCGGGRRVSEREQEADTREARVYYINTERETRRREISATPPPRRRLPLTAGRRFNYLDARRPLRSDREMGFSTARRENAAMVRYDCIKCRGSGPLSTAAAAATACKRASERCGG